MSFWCQWSDAGGGLCCRHKECCLAYHSGCYIDYYKFNPIVVEEIVVEEKEA